MSAAKRPTWLPDGCPSWCDAGDQHTEADHYDDRVHGGASDAVVLTGDIGEVGDTELPGLQVHLQQHYREVAPRIHLGKNEMLGSYMTLEEAEQLAEALLHLVEIGRGK